MARRAQQPEKDRKATPGACARPWQREYPDAVCALVHADPYQLLVATVLSAQCTDVRVNMVTPELFRRFPDPASLARGDQEEVEALIRSTGFFRAKTRSLLAMAPEGCRGLRREDPGGSRSADDAAGRRPQDGQRGAWHGIRACFRCRGRHTREAAGSPAWAIVACHAPPDRAGLDGDGAASRVGEFEPPADSSWAASVRGTAAAL